MLKGVKGAIIYISENETSSSNPAHWHSARLCITSAWSDFALTPPEFRVPPFIAAHLPCRSKVSLLRLYCYASLIPENRDHRPCSSRNVPPSFSPSLFLRPSLRPSRRKPRIPPRP